MGERIYAGREDAAALATAREWWGGMWSDRVVASAFAEQAIEGGLATRDELDAISVAWREWSESPDAWFAIVHGEIRART